MLAFNAVYAEYFGRPASCSLDGSSFADCRRDSKLEVDVIAVQSPLIALNGLGWTCGRARAFSFLLFSFFSTLFRSLIRTSCRQTNVVLVPF